MISKVLPWNSLKQRYLLQYEDNKQYLIATLSLTQKSKALHETYITK